MTILRNMLFVLLALGLFVGSSGCGKRKAGEPKNYSATDYGKLPGLRETPHRKLSDELNRIVEEGATPELLVRKKIPPEQNVVAGLKDLFSSGQLLDLVDRTDKLFPSGRFDFNSATLEEVVKFQKQYRGTRRRIRLALKRPQCDFEIDQMAGYLVDLSFVDVVWVSNRLEAFEAAESLFVEDDPGKAIESVQAMLQLAGYLAAEKHLTSRLQAAFLRTETLSVLSAIVDHPQVTREHLKRLYEALKHQLDIWPNDAQAWIGDRAAGLHAYEMVRNGELALLMTKDEIEQLDREGYLKSFVVSARRKVNQDELYYLQTMRRMIDDCSKPYYERLAWLTTLDTRIKAQKSASEFPVAVRLLLPKVKEGHTIQACDRTICEATALALAEAAGLKRPLYQLSPMSGGKYVVRNQDGEVEVSNLGIDKDDEQRILISIPSQGGSRRQPIQATARP